MFVVHFWWWLQYRIGMTNGAGRPYLFWSGFGSDLTEFGVLVSGIIIILRRIEIHHQERRQQHEELIKQLKE